MGDNEQQQADEIAVLQSIYPDDVAVAEDNSIEANVNVPIPTSFEVIAIPDSASVEGQTCPLTTLPPIILTIIYHPGYPSSDPPMFTMSCCWLSKLQLSRLCRKFDEIWDEAVGEVVVFKWMTWLGEEALSFLGITSPYTLPTPESDKNLSEEQQCELDSRAQSDCDPFTIGYLIEFDKRARREQFLRSEHTCSICYMDYPGTQFIQQANCEHYFCKDCMCQMSQVHINSGSVDHMKCPDKQCKQQVHPQVVQQLVSPELYAKYERLLLDRSLQSMDDVMWCPHCSTPVIIDVKLELGACTKCHFSFCTTCMQTWHPGTPCKSSEHMMEAMKQRAMSSTKQSEVNKLKSELDSLSYLMTNTKMCPKCKLAIEKTEGCNKMTCYNCGSYFCWQCRCAIPGYEHFRLGKCTLFPNTPLYNPDGGGGGDDFGQAQHEQMIPRLNAQQRRWVNREVMRMRQAFVVAHDPANVKKCPRCRNNIVREQNNNHVVCWRCNGQYCFLCLEPIIGTTHFSRGKCKQHS